MAFPILAAIGIAAAAGKAISSFSQASQAKEAARRQAKALREQADFNAKLYDKESDYLFQQEVDTIVRGDEISKRIIRAGYDEGNSLIGKARKIQAEQKSVFAAQGILINEGTPAILQDQTDYAARADQYQILQAAHADALETRNNAWREAFGIGENRRILNMKKDMMLKSAKFQIEDVLETGGNQATQLRMGGLFDLGTSVATYGASSIGGGSTASASPSTPVRPPTTNIAPVFGKRRPY